MAELIEIQINKDTLPKDGSKVEWQSQDDQDNSVWKQGTYSDDDPDQENDAGNAGLFLVGFEETTSNWDCAWKVLHWKYLE